MIRVFQVEASRVHKLIQSCTLRIKKLFEEYQEVDLQRNANGDVSSTSVKDVCDLKSISFWATEHSYPISLDVRAEYQFL